MLRPKFTTASDVFSVGVLLFELATRRLPYEGADDLSIRESVKAGEREEITLMLKCPSK